jgi:hypothetical protein
MANKGYVDQLVNGLPTDLRYPIGSAIKYLMDNWRVGTGARAINAQWYRVSATTASVANAEFAVKHGLPGPPSQLFPVLDLSQINSQLVPLTVSKAPDATYLYLKSASASAPFTVLVEP